MWQFKFSSVLGWLISLIRNHEIEFEYEFKIEFEV